MSGIVVCMKIVLYRHDSPNPAPLLGTLARFRQELSARNVSPQTLRAYESDVRDCIRFLLADNALIETPADVTRDDLIAYLASLADRKLSGVTRARKRAAVRAYFAVLVAAGLLARSPAETLPAPKREERTPGYLSSDEYTRLLALAGSSPRDHCLLEVALQTGLRVSELCDLAVDDIDLAARTLTVREGKGRKGRVVPLEKKALAALRNYLKARPETLERQLFLNRYGAPLGDRGVRKLLAKYVAAAGLTKHVSPHTLRHTFSTAKAKRGVSPYELQQWLGHSKLSTTQRYVHIAHQDTAKVMEATSL